MGRRGARRGVLAVAAAVGCAASAATVAASTPPPKALLVDPAHGSVGGLELGQPASTYVQALGLPDYSGPVESPRTQEMLWTLTPAPTTAWAILTLTSRAVAVEFRFGGRFRTANGDKPGTSLKTFELHWKKPAGIVYPVVRNGVTVEYNVAVGRVVFAFDKRMKLQAVGLSPDAVGARRCLIPDVCVTSSLG